MIQEFIDDGEIVHDAFQLWRTEHQDGLFLGLKTRTKANLHGARCHHLGSGPPYFTSQESTHSLTAKRKICGTADELAAWATENAVEVTLCQHCLRDGIISDRLTFTPSSEDVAPFDPTEIADERERILAGIVRRRGQSAFRACLLDAYGKRCAITGCTAEPVLEAAHIVPYQGEKTNHPANGLLLRGDLHTLFDLNLIAIDDDRSVLISSSLDGTEYQELRGKLIALPQDAATRPSQEALATHRSSFK